MKNLLILLMLFSISQLNIAQKNFKEFLNLFPEYSWNELPSDIVQFKLSEKTIDADSINKFFFDIDNKIEKFVKGNTYYSVPAPHIIYTDGKYGIGAGGRFNNKWNGKPTILKAMARVNFNDSIVLLFIYYKTFAVNYEVYTFNTKTEQLLSSLRLSEEGGDVICSGLSFLDKNFEVTYFQEYYVEDEKKNIFSVHNKLRNDGYFQETKVVNMDTSNVLFVGIVKDIDGYANVREKPDLNSKVLYRALDGRIVYVETIQKSDWHKILVYNDYKKDHYREFLREGYIHKSRVVKRK